MRIDAARRQYDRLAPYYDPLLEVVFHRLLRLGRWRRRTVDALGDLDGARILDVGCGTGTNLPLLLPKLGARGRVVGIDVSRRMLERADRRLTEDERRRVDLVRGDIARIEDTPGSFDAVVAVWSLGIVEDLDGAVDAIVRLLRPGGRLAVLDFRQPHPDAGWLRRTRGIWQPLLLRLGIDDPEDLDPDRLHDRWSQAMERLAPAFPDLRSATYLRGAGLWITGTRGEAMVATPA